MRGRRAQHRQRASFTRPPATLAVALRALECTAATCRSQIKQVQEAVNKGTQTCQPTAQARRACTQHSAALRSARRSSNIPVCFCLCPLPVQTYEETMTYQVGKALDQRTPNTRSSQRSCCRPCHSVLRATRFQLSKCCVTEQCAEAWMRGTVACACEYRRRGLPIRG